MSNTNNENNILKSEKSKSFRIWINDGSYRNDVITDRSDPISIGICLCTKLSPNEFLHSYQKKP